MNYALQIGAQGALTSMYRADVLANNLANLGTDSFKPDVPYLRERDPVRVEDGVMGLPSNALLERLGAGPHLAPTLTSFAQGPLSTTGRRLDVAIDGEGFLMVGDAGGRKLTRDGRLSRDEDGRLVQASTGKPVLDAGGRTILIAEEDGPVDIDERGVIRQGDLTVARLALVDTPDRRQLTKEGSGLFALPDSAAGSLRPASGRLVQEAVEQSAVNEISTLNDLTSALRAVGANIGAMTYADQMMERAINRLGRVA